MVSGSWHRVSDVRDHGLPEQVKKKGGLYQ